jgi:glycosyltransferase involved in cell wall biosynthesis
MTTNILCIVAIFKNETHILKEWIEHYLHQGVEKFFLIDNGSTDQYMDILHPYIQNNTLKLVIDPEKHQQPNHMNKYFLKEVQPYEWVLVCDLDEFVYARKGFSTITDYLATLSPNVSMVYIPWKMFGSNGLKFQPDNVVQSFTRRTDYDKENSQKYSNVKCIARTRFLKKFFIHSHETDTDTLHVTTEVPPPMVSSIHDNKLFVNINETILENSCLHLNHYAIQSLDWFKRIKMTRGAADSSQNENVRTIGYFHAYDEHSNDLEDNELANINAF